MRWLIPALTFLLASCSASLGPDTTGTIPATDVAGFGDIVRAVQPVMTQECRRRAKNGTNCNFLIVVDPHPRAPPNAYQSVDDQGRPVLTFTASLISAVRNADELAFILSHEAAHQIAGHLARQQQNAADAAEVFAGLATLTGGDAGDVTEAQKLGAAVGARSYAKEFELEADELGTIITYRAGFNPLLGAQFFTRIPDPGDQFLGTHPPNAERLEMVRRTAARLGVSQ
jgi:Zn-dependent protease with chaperone function